MDPTATPVHGVTPDLADRIVPIESLELYPGDPRRGDLDAITDSLQAHGQYRPLVVNRRDGQILAGNHTCRAARELGWTHIAATWVDVDVDTAARIMLVDNRTSDLAGYDTTALAEILGGLPDLTGTGYTDADLAALLEVITDPVALTDPDDVPDLPAAPVTQLGDVWTLGPHTVICGSATDTDMVLSVLGDQRADMVWTDPPYGVNYVGKTKDRLEITGDDSAGLGELLEDAFGTVLAVTLPGAPVYVAHSDAERVTFEAALRAAGLLVRQNLVWVKNSLVMGRADYHYRHEPILYGFTPGGSGRLGRGGERWYGDNKQSTVFEVAKPNQNKDHPTMKPVELITAMLGNSLAVGGVVFDPFGGSGSTLIAAHHHNTRAVLVELDPRYVDVICRRRQDHTGLRPVRASDQASAGVARAV